MRDVMAKEKPLEMITPPNALKAKLGGPLTLGSKTAIARAEMALQSLSHEFEGWLEEEIERLESAWKSASALDDREADLMNVYRVSHDLKGLAGTYGYPLITRFAASLCRLLNNVAMRSIAPKELVGAHVATCRVAMRDDIRTDENDTGRMLAEELDNQVAAVKAALEKKTGEG